MIDPLTIGGGIVLLLCAYLYFIVMRRWVAEDSAKSTHAIQSPTTIDVSPLSKKLEQVRNNPVAAVRHDPRSRTYRERLIATAKTLLGERSFFATRKGDQEHPVL